MRRLDSKENWGADKLEAELQAARDGLRELDRDIRKILGRDLPDTENGLNQQSVRVGQKRIVQDDRKRNVTDYTSNNDHHHSSGGKRSRWQSQSLSSPPASTPGEPKTVFSRLSARVPSTADDSDNDDDNPMKPAVSSRVIATPREIPSRQEVIRRERVDERSRQRNKRMFGALLGTLQKFRQEETKLKAKEDKKAEVEARVEEAKRREKEELKRERQQLFLSRKRQLAEVKALESKLARSKQFQIWKNAQLPLASFIKTQATPAIYYLPKRKHPKTDTLLEQCAKELHAEVERREKSLAEEIEAIESQINANKQNQSIDKSEGMEINEIQIMEDGEENRDPNPEIKDKVNDNESSPVGIKSEFQVDTNEDNLKNDHIEVTKTKKIDESNEDEDKVNKNYG
ncbi:pinin [Microplitis mediator]|uniref:pinin n=1 Tax=Microplitis mediator TaxID=375433 RepID=UPI0025540DF8|nr:pinin [Microplitis mediator]